MNSQWDYRIFPAGNVSLIGSDGNLFTAPFNLVSFPHGVIGNPGRTNSIPAMDITFLYDGWKDHTLRLNLGAKQEKLKANASQNFGPSVIDGTEGVVNGTLTDITGTAYVCLSDNTRKVKYLSIQDSELEDPDSILIENNFQEDLSEIGGQLLRLEEVFNIKEIDFECKAIEQKQKEIPSDSLNF